MVPGLGERPRAGIVPQPGAPHNALMATRIIEIPCRADNFAYVVAAAGSGDALVVDPSAAEPVQAALQQAGLRPAAVLCTHHHFDHTGGVEALAASNPDLAVVAHVSDRGRVAELTEGVEQGQSLRMAGLSVGVLHVPGHTRGSLAYVIEDAVFTGDTLFVAGCGRLFEGTAEQMFKSLTKLASLPPETRVYCGHEYTSANLRFAVSVEPDNEAVAAKLEWADEQTSEGRPTVPSTIEDELATNPFLRAAQPALATRFGGGAPVEVFAAARRAKDAF